MRLTLRALLNWIHHNLSPEDAALIAQKVSGNEFATTLKNQLEAVVKIPDLPALFVLDGTPLGNPNSTAEYLDNVMSTEMTPEFEKFCLHSEVVLAEVVDCHQILSEVLSLSLEPDETMQKRIHGLYALYYGTPETPPMDTGADLDVLQEAKNIPVEPSHGPKRFTRLQWGIWGGIVLVLLLILVLGRGGQEDQKSSSEKIAEVPPLEETLPEEENKEEGEGEPAEKPAEVPAKTEETEVAAPTTEETAPPAESERAESSETPPETAGEESEKPASEEIPEEVTLAEDGNEETDLEENEELEEVWEEEEEPFADAEVQEGISTGGQKIGTLISSVREFLWRQSSARDGQRISPREAIRKGQIYGSWDGFRPRLELLYQLEITLLGNSRVRVESSPEATRIWDVIPEYGRFIFHLPRDSDESDEFHLVFSSREMSYVRLHPGARMGVNVHLTRGTDPAVTPHTIIDLLVLDGTVEVYDGGEVRTVDAAQAPQGIYWDSLEQGAVLPAALDSIPLWVMQDQKNAVRENAEKVRKLLEEELEMGKTLTEGLQTLAASDSQAPVAVQRLAKKYLAVLGNTRVLQSWAEELKSEEDRKADFAQKSLQEVLLLSPWHAQQVKSVLNAEDYQWLWEE
ncbi:MAG: hypothetical protein Q4D62_11965 [Planctomycetia bacterium]|nr:hypothetical protein [Planctomycetia bacterium]